MFKLECLIYCLILLYSILFQLRVIISYIRNKNIKIKNGSGLSISKDILNKNEIGTLYVTKVNGLYSSHYDISRNVIRLSNDVYEEENLSSVVVAFYEALKAVINKNKDRRKEKIKLQILDYCNKIFFVLFIIGASVKAVDVMSISLLVLIIVIVIHYLSFTEVINLIPENINFIKKEYKIKNDVKDKLEDNLRLLIYNELSLHIFNRKY